jgi:hypothetical protein
MNGVLGERLVRRIDIDLNVDEPESRIHLFVQKCQEGPDVLRALISRVDAQVGEVR